MRTGLPNNHVDAIFADSDGFLWIASVGGGLLRYDGYTFFSPVVQNMGFVPRSNSCRSITEDRFHRLWVCFDEGTDVIDLRTMQKLFPSTSTPPTSLDSLLSLPAVRCHSDGRGNVWLVARTYIYYIAFDEDGRPEPALSYHYDVANAPDVMVRDVEHNGTVWATIDGGVYKLVPQGEQLVRQEIVPLLSSLPTGYVSDFLRHDDFIWVSTVDGLYRYNTRSYQLDHFTHTSTLGSLSHNATTCLSLLADGTLLVGTLGGLNIYRPQTNTFDCLSTSSPTPLSSDFVKEIFLMGQQIWIATETGGITRLIPRQLKLRNFVHSADATSLSPNAVNAMYVEPDGTLWIGTVEGGLNCQKEGQDGFSHLTTSNSALPHNSVSTLTADNRGRLWVGTWGGGLCYVDTRTGTVERFTLGDAYDRLTPYIGALAFDPFNNGLWVGANDGLFFYDFNTQRVSDPFKGNREVRGCIGSLVSNEGELWIGCLDGARVVSLKKRDAKGSFPCRALRYRLDDAESHVIEKLSCFCQASDGSLWLGSNEYGLYHRVVDKNGGEQFIRYTQQQGLANNAVKGIVEDAKGQLWITTNNGLSMLNPSTGIFANYGEDDGLLSSQFYWNSAVKGPDGTVYLGSVRGLTKLSGIDRTATPAVGQLRFTHLVVDNLDITAPSRHLDEDITQARLLRLHESNKSFVLSFSALNYASIHHGIYSYRLRGFDDTWTQLPAGEHSVRYTALPPGSYTLEVRYESAYSQDAPQLLTLRIDVSAYFWHSWWFISALVLLLVILATWLYQLRLQRLSERIKKEEERRMIEPIEKAVLESRNPEQMQARIQEILHIQQQLEASTSKSAEADNEEARLKDVPFMERVMRIMEQNYKNSEFGVQQLCEAMGMSRSLLSKRLNAETGLPASQFMRNYRLNIAHELLLRKNASRNVADIAFSVGFNDPKYFTRCFHRHYGQPPSSFMLSQQNQETPQTEP